MTGKQAEELLYIHLPAGSALPSLDAKPCRVVIIAEQHVPVEWQSSVAKWVIEKRCLFMMAWGLDCEIWHDAVDWAAHDLHGYEDVADDDFVMTSWHENEPLSEALFFCRCVAFHPTASLDRAILLHIAEVPRREEILRCYDKSTDIEDE